MQDPKVGEAVLIRFHHGDHVSHTAFATVLAVNFQEEDAPAILSLAYMQPNASHRNLSGPNWWKEFRRATGVKHDSHPDVLAGREPITWGGAAHIQQDDVAAAAPADLNMRPADPSERLKRKAEPEATEVSRQQAVRVQTATEQPAATVVSPAVNEPDLPVLEPAADPTPESPSPEPATTSTDGSESTGQAPLTLGDTTSQDSSEETAELDADGYPF